VTENIASRILFPDEGPIVTVANAAGAGPVCIVCEHASAFIPASLGALGLSPWDLHAHAVWDPGAEKVSRALSARLDARAVLSRVSRLVYDCNRPPERSDATPDRVETIEIPGNRDLDPAHRAQRVAEIYDVFHAAVAATLDAFTTPPVLVTVHSFTPVWNGAPRATELGLLHDADATLARAMLGAADPAIRTELNKPYSASDGVTHTLARHGTARGLRNVMIEVRNDLLQTEAQVERMADVLAAMLDAARAEGAFGA
jgi:predicted N-formylglutamate amidohydrolase